MRWKKPDFRMPKQWPYSFIRYEPKELPRDSNNIPLLIPSLRDKSKDAILYREAVLRDQISKLENPHEKIYKFREHTVSKAKKCFIIDPLNIGVDSLPAIQFLTQTRLIRDVPNVIKENLNSISDAMFEKALSIANNCFIEENFNVDRSYISYIKNKFFLPQLFSSLLRYLTSQFDYLEKTNVTTDCEVISFWHRKSLEISSTSKPDYLLRTMDPLNSFVERNDALCYKGCDIPSLDENISYFGISKKPVNLLIFPGFKPGSRFKYVHTQLFSMNAKGSTYFPKFDPQFTVDSASIANLFNQTSALAWYQGCTPFQDVFHPIVTHNFTSNGTEIGFYCYQLNSIAIGKGLPSMRYDVNEDNEHCNICWSTNLMPITFSNSVGKTEINPEIVKYALAVLMNSTSSKFSFNSNLTSEETLFRGSIPLVYQEDEKDPGLYKKRRRQRGKTTRKKPVISLENAE